PRSTRWSTSCVKDRRTRTSLTSNVFKFQLSCIFLRRLTSGNSEGHAHVEELKRAIRDVRNFPKPGSIFRDVTPALLDPTLLGQAVKQMTDPYRSAGITRVVAIESRGFLLGAPIALDLGAGLVPIREPGKLPAATQRVEYEDRKSVG